MTTIRTICYGCGKVLVDGPGDGELSHGLCPDCIRRLYPEYASEILDDGFERAADCVSGYGND